MKSKTKGVHVALAINSKFEYILLPALCAGYNRPAVRPKRRVRLFYGIIDNWPEPFIRANKSDIWIIDVKDCRVTIQLVHIKQTVFT